MYCCLTALVYNCSIKLSLHINLLYKFRRDIFSLGFGPFRWVCTSGDPQDLSKTDKIATDVLKEIIKSKSQTIHYEFNRKSGWIDAIGVIIIVFIIFFKGAFHRISINNMMIIFVGFVKRKNTKWLSALRLEFFIRIKKDV